MAKPTLLLTRPAASSIRFATRLNTATPSQAELVISPMLDIVALDQAVDLKGVASVIFTSGHGVAHGPEGNGMQAHCVGKATAIAAQAKGWRLGHVAQDAERLIPVLQKSGITGPLLHLSGKFQRGNIAEVLTKSGIPTRRVAIYDQRMLPLTEAAQAALCGEGAVVLPLFSPRTANYVVQQAKGFVRVYGIAMSAAVAHELAGISLEELQILPEPTAEAMVQAVELLLANDRLA